MKDNFYFDKSENSFIGKLQILNKSIELEIKLNDSEVNWKDIKRFVESLNDDYIPKILDTSAKLLLEFIKLVPFAVSEPLNDYDFRLEAIIYYGKVNNHIFEDLVDGFELIFKQYHTDYIECNDPYGNYYVRVNNRLITGVGRNQI